MRCAFLSYQPFLDPNANGRALASAAMLDAVSPLADVELVYLTASSDLVQTTRQLRERFPAVSAVKVLNYEIQVPAATCLMSGARLLPPSLAALESERIRHAVAQLHADPSLDVVHYDLESWLYVHPEAMFPTAPTVCSGADNISPAYRRKATFAGDPIERVRELAKAFIFERFERRYLARADIVQLASAEDAKYFEEKGIRGVFRLANTPLGDKWFAHRQDGRQFAMRVLTSGQHSQRGYRAGLLRFLRGVWPPQASRFPDAALTVHSTQPVRGTRAAASVAPRTTLVGDAADFGSLLANHDVFVHPLLGGMGQKSQLVIAMAQGACCLATDSAASGMQLKPFEHYLPLTDLSMSDSVRLGDVLVDHELAARVAANGRRRVQAEFSNRAVGIKMMDLYREAIDIGRQRRTR